MNDPLAPDLAALATALNITPPLLISPPPDSGTAFQLLLPAAHGGIALPDPALVSPAAFTASCADTFPALQLDTTLAPFLTDTASYPTSASPILAALHHTFHDITSLPTFTAPLTEPSPLHLSVPSTLTGPDGTFQLSLLPLIADRHCQHLFTAAIFRNQVAM